MAETSINIDCPECKANIEIKLEQVENQAVITCPRCKREIHLKDSKGSTKKAVKDVNKGMQDLHRALKKLSNIKIGL